MKFSLQVLFLLNLGSYLITFAVGHEQYQSAWPEFLQNLPGQAQREHSRVNEEENGLEERQIITLTPLRSINPSFITASSITPLSITPSTVIPSRITPSSIAFISITTPSTSTVPTKTPALTEAQTSTSIPLPTSTATTLTLTLTPTPTIPLTFNPTSPLALTTTLTLPSECTIGITLLNFPPNTETYLWQNYPFPISSVTATSCLPAQFGASLISRAAVTTSISEAMEPFRWLVCPEGWEDYDKNKGWVGLGYHVCCPSGYEPVIPLRTKYPERPAKAALCASDLPADKEFAFTAFREGGVVEIVRSSTSGTFVWAMPLEGGVMGGTGFVEAGTGVLTGSGSLETGTGTGTGVLVATTTATSTGLSGGVRRGVDMSFLLVGLVVLVGF